MSKAELGQSNRWSNWIRCAYQYRIITNNLMTEKLIWNRSTDSPCRRWQIEDSANSENSQTKFWYQWLRMKMTMVLNFSLHSQQMKFQRISWRIDLHVAFKAMSKECKNGFRSTLSFSTYLIRDGCQRPENSAHWLFATIAATSSAAWITK